MITCVIIDDERNAREFLEKLINRKFSKKLMVLDAAESGKMVWRSLKNADQI